MGIQVFNLLTQEGEHHHGAKPGKATTANVNHSLKRLRHALEKEQVQSLALPKLATGVGGLAWSDVLPLVRHHLAESETVVFVYTQFHQSVQARKARRVNKTRWGGHMNGFSDATPASEGGAAPHRPEFVLRSFGLSDRGKQRDSNEDCFAVARLVRPLRIQHTNLPQSKTNLSSHRGYVFLIADGMGGSNAGEIASGLSVTSIEDFLLNTLKRFSTCKPTKNKTPCVRCKKPCARPTPEFLGSELAIRSGKEWAPRSRWRLPSIGACMWPTPAIAAAICIRAKSCNS